LLEVIIARIGPKIREARKANDLSTKELAERSGMSPAAINKIERNLIIPTIATLYKIANALDRSVSFFVDEEEIRDDRGFIKKGERSKIHNPASRVTFENIAARLKNCLIDAGFSVIEPGGGSGRNYMTHLGEELIYCLEGEVEYFLEGEKCILRPGDSLHFKSSIPHRWTNKTNSPAKVLGIITPPPFFK
jgi:transcriptional regulator with XRE-family HTH domain